LGKAHWAVCGARIRGESEHSFGQASESLGRRGIVEHCTRRRGDFRRRYYLVEVPPLHDQEQRAECCFTHDFVFVVK